MNRQLVAQAEVLRQTVERLVRVGLVFNRASLSAEQRRVVFALQHCVPDTAPQPVPTRAPIGFAYPNAG